MVNDHTAFRTDWMPFAGRRQSGYGVGGIPYTMREMTQEKMIVLRRSPTHGQALRRRVRNLRRCLLRGALEQGAFRDPSTV